MPPPMRPAPSEQRPAREPEYALPEPARPQAPRQEQKPGGVERLMNRPGRKDSEESADQPQPVPALLRELNQKK